MTCQISEPRNQSAPHKTVPNTIPKRTSPALMGGRSRRGSTVSRSTSISLRRSFLTPGLNRDQYLSIRPISDIHHRSPSRSGAKFFLTKTASRPEAVIALPPSPSNRSRRRCLSPAVDVIPNPHYEVPLAQTFLSIPLNEAPLPKALLDDASFCADEGLPGIKQENPKLIAFGIPSEELKLFIQAR